MSELSLQNEDTTLKQRNFPLRWRSKYYDTTSCILTRSLNENNIHGQTPFSLLLMFGY